MMVVIGLVVTMIEDGGEIGRTVVQPVMVAGATTVRATLAIEEELSTIEVAQEAPVITILPLKLNTLNTAEEVTGPMIIVALAVTDRDYTSMGAVMVVLATHGMNGKL